MEQPINGTLVSVEDSPYRAFTGSDGTPVAAGTAFYAWVIQSPNSAPSRIQLPDRESAEKMRQSIGKPITLRCRAFAQNNTLRYKVMPAA